MNCHACGAALTSTARFCHKCGAQVGGGQASGWRAGLPWGVAGAALGALLTGGALPFSRGGGGGGGPPAAPGGTPPPPPPPLQCPHTSQNSPAERATPPF